MHVMIAIANDILLLQTKRIFDKRIIIIPNDREINHFDYNNHFTNNQISNGYFIIHEYM